MESKLFYKCLAISFVLHLMSVVYFSVTHFQYFKKPVKSIQVTYQKLASPKPAELAKNEQNFKVVKDKSKARDVDVIEKNFGSESLEGRNLRSTEKDQGAVPMDRKLVTLPKSFDMHRKITVPMMKTEKINNPQYLTYNDYIRNQIKQNAYKFIDHPDFKTGDVYLTFSLSADGTLKQVKIIDEKSHANDFLKRIGIKSVQQASPFPKFPKDLNYPELTFNVIISFEINE